MSADRLRIVAADFDDDRVVHLLTHHAVSARAQTGADSAHAIDADDLRHSDVEVWAAWYGERLVGVGALKPLSRDDAEIKSMHTTQQARRLGVASAMLDHLVRIALEQGRTRLYLETGSWPYFAAARALYAARGFVACAPFHGYRDDPNSVFMTRDLRSPSAPATTAQRSKP